MPKAVRVDDRRTRAGRRYVNGLSLRPESWKGLAQAAYKKQLAPKGEGALRGAFSKSPYRATENGDFA